MLPYNVKRVVERVEGLSTRLINLYRFDTPLIDNLLNLFETSQKVGYRDTFIWLMGLFEQARATDVGTDANPLKLSAISCIGSTSFYTLAHHLREEMAKCIVYRRVHR